MRHEQTSSRALVMKSDQLASVLFEAAPDALLIVAPDGGIVHVNRQVERLFGYERAELAGKEVETLVPEHQRELHRSHRERFLRGPLTRPMNERPLAIDGVRRDGTLVPVEISLAPFEVEGTQYVMAVVRDMTDRRRLEDHLLFLSMHDALTGLANRGAFDEALRRFEECGPHPIGVVVVDLDGLKAVNDTQGHAAGDALLRRTASVLKATFRAGDVVSRIGGDEFAVLAAGHDAESLEVMAVRLEAAVRAHNAEGGNPVSLSVGTAVAREGASLRNALREADIAMYVQKRARKDVAVGLSAAHH